MHSPVPNNLKSFRQNFDYCLTASNRIPPPLSNDLIVTLMTSRVFYRLIIHSLKFSNITMLNCMKALVRENVFPYLIE